MVWCAEIRASGGPAAAHPGGQGGSGRPRPRQQGDRFGLRGPRLRRRPRAPLRRALSEHDITILAIHFIYTKLVQVLYSVIYTLYITFNAMYRT